MTTKQRAVKIDRRTMAWLDAAVIDCVNRQDKCRAAVLIDELAHDDIEVTFDQVVKSVRRLGFTWADAFLPASKAERNGGHKQAESKNATVASGPDMRAVLNRIEQLEQTLTRRGLAEYSGLLQQAQTEAGLAKERAAAMRADMKTVLEQLDRISRRQDILYNIVGSVRLEHDRQKAARSLLQDAEHASPEETQQ